jgi:hypothetical protein
LYLCELMCGRCSTQRSRLISFCSRRCLEVQVLATNKAGAITKRSTVVTVIMQAHRFTRLTRSLITLLSAVHPPTYFLSLEGGYSTTLPLHAHCAHSILFRRHTTSVRNGADSTSAHAVLTRLQIWPCSPPSWSCL